MSEPNHLERALQAIPRTPPIISKPNKPIPPTPEEIRSARTCHTKVPYPTAQAAKNKARINESLEVGLKLYFYRCATCHRWHLTRTKP